MFGEALPDLAIRGEGGIDVFDRQDQPDHRRSRFRCLGRVRRRADGTEVAEGFVPEARQNPDRLLHAARALDIIDAAGTGAAHRFALTDATGFPRAAGSGDPVLIFLRIDFLRAWMLADLGLDRFRATLASDPAPLIDRPGQLAAQVALAFDFNRIGMAVELAQALLPALPHPGKCADGHAYALRMLGDLTLRGNAAKLALDCFEAAIEIGDNPHRRARARAAAEALGDLDALARHSLNPGPATRGQP